MTNVFPSTEELIPPVLLAKLPAKLVKDIADRYETLGEKYLTEEVYFDGRRINGMMFTSRIDNCLEEVVDAVFCILGWIFKVAHKGQAIPINAYSCLTGLIEVYSMLEAERYGGAQS